MKAWNSPSGVATGSINTSVVVLEPVPITILRSSKLTPTPTQNRSSVSRYTHTSDSTAVPTRCRHTASGRQESSNSTQNTHWPSGVKHALPMPVNCSGSSLTGSPVSSPARSRMRKSYRSSPATSTPYSIQRPSLLRSKPPSRKKSCPRIPCSHQKRPVHRAWSRARLADPRPAGPSHRHRARGCGIARHTVCPAACG